MAKTVKIPDPVVGLHGGMPMPLRLTFRNKRKVSKHTYVGNRLRVKCGCCDEALEIHLGDDYSNQFAVGETLEIGGVMGTIAQWREVLLPLLGMEVPDELEVVAPQDSILQHFNTFAAAENEKE